MFDPWLLLAAAAALFSLKQGGRSPLHDASVIAQPRNQVPQYAYAICYSGLDDGPQGDLPFLLPSQLANIIPSLHFETLRGCIESGDIVFDLFVHVSISQSARPSQASRDAYDAAVKRVATAAGVRKVTIVHEVDKYIQPHKLDAEAGSAIMGSSHGQLQNWLQQVYTQMPAVTATHSSSCSSL
jgi:hypothetical protein